MKNFSACLNNNSPITVYAIYVKSRPTRHVRKLLKRYLELIPAAVDCVKMTMFCEDSPSHFLQILRRALCTSKLECR